MIGFIICCIFLIVLFVLGMCLMQFLFDRWYFGGGFIFLWFLIYYLMQQNMIWFLEIILKIWSAISGIPIPY